MTVTNFSTPFQGRANRTTFLVSVIGLAVFSFIFRGIGGSVIAAIIWLLIILFQLAIWTRRFHDLGKSGYWSLLALIPFVDLFVFVYLLFKPGETKTNMYGKIPQSIHF